MAQYNKMTQSQHITIWLLSNFFPPTTASNLSQVSDDNKSLRVSWTFLSIQANLNKTVVFVLTLISNSFRVFFQTPVVVSSTQTKYFNFSLPFIFTQWSTGTVQPNRCKRFFFLLTNIKFISFLLLLYGYFPPE